MKNIIINVYIFIMLVYSSFDKLNALISWLKWNITLQYI